MITIKEELDFNDLLDRCWSGAIDTLEKIQKEDKEDEFMSYLEEIYFMSDSELPTMTELNDYIRFESDEIFTSLDIEN